MVSKWSIRACREGDEAGIYSLWKAAYGDRVSGYDRWLRWWRWMYRKNPCGNSRIRLAVDGVKIVGQYALAPIRLKIREDIMTAWLALNIMTHPDYRRQGVFETLAQTVYQEARKEGLALFYGFPSREARPEVLKHSHLVAVSPLRVMIKPLNWENTLRLRLNSRLLQNLGAYGGAMAYHIIYGLRSSSEIKDVTVTLVYSFDNRVNDLWERMKSRFACCVVKDQAYLNWRYTGLDDHSQIFIAEDSGDLNGYMVVREVTRNKTRMALVFDLMAESEPVLHGLIKEVVNHLRENQVDVLVYQALTDKRHRYMLARNGFISVPFVQGTLPAFCVRYVSQKLTAALPLSKEEWFIQLGDSDAVNGYNI